ncbi:MAG: sigma-70 family RNA polymerase sigma factor [Planctomycetes bacterium]|nr:sigma-70 family RNA polymerase sigma factor [Planctomycetota bacterium]
MDGSDESLMSVFQRQGDQEALAELIRRHSAWVYKLALSILHDPAAAEDATQQTFVHLIESRSSYRPDACFKPWVGRIAVNACLKLHRSHQRRRSRERDAAPRTDLQHASAETEALQSLLRDLEPELRLPLLLCYQEGFSQAEAAAVLGLAPRTLSDRIRRGLDLLKERIPLAGMAIVLADIPHALSKAPTPPVPQSLDLRLRAAFSTLTLRAVPRIILWAAAVAVLGASILVGSLLVRPRRARSPEDPTASASFAQGHSDKGRAGVAAEPTPPEARSVVSPADASSQAELRGKVIRWPDDRPIAGASVTLKSPTDETRTVQTDAAGAFHFAGLGDAEYELTAIYQLLRHYREKILLSGSHSEERRIALYAGTGSAILTVLDEISQPVEGVSLRIWGHTHRTQILSLLTNHQGQVQLTALPAGEYVVQTRDGGCFSQKLFPVNADEENHVQITLRGTACIEGHIRTEQGDPIPGLYVNFFSPALKDGAEYDVSDIAGHYSLPNIPAGLYRLVIRETGHETSVALARGQRLCVDFAVPALPATLAVTVRDKSTGQPIAGAKVSLSILDKEFPTDDQGRVHLSFPQPVEIRIVARATGYRFADRDLRLDVGSNEQVLELAPFSRPEKPIEPRVPLRGQIVYRDDRAPVRDAAIYCRRAGDRPSSSSSFPDVITAPDGKFRCEAPPGELEIEVALLGTDVRHFFPVPVEDAQQDITLELERDTCTLQGHIYGYDGTVGVYLKPKDGTATDQLTLKGPEKRYRFVAREGLYCLQVYAGLLRWYERHVQLRAGETKTADISIPVGSAILHGSIRTFDGSPLPFGAVRVTLTTTDGEAIATFSRYSDRSGRFEFHDLPARTYRLEWGPDNGSWSQHVDLTLEEGTATRQDLTLPFSATLDLSVTDESGTQNLLPSSTVELRSPQTHPSPLPVDKRNRPWLLPPGSYHLRVTAAGFHPYEAALTIPTHGALRENVRLRKAPAK